MRAPEGQSRSHRLLGHIATALLVFTLIAFGLKALIHTEVQARYTPIVIAHALSMVAWLGLLAGQAYLASARRLKTHRMLGTISLALVAVMTATGMIIAVNIGKELGRVEVTIVNVAAFATFLPLYAAALWFAVRRHTAEHRMAMLVGTLALMTPAYARMIQVLGLPDPLAIAVQVPITVAIALGYEWTITGKATRPTLVMLAFSVGLIAIMGAALIALVGMPQ